MEQCRDANGLITMYKIQFQGQPSGTLCRNIDANVNIEVPGQYDMSGQTTVTVTPFTDYSIQVAAVNEEGDVGMYSEPPVTRTTPEGSESAACGRYVHRECNVYIMPSFHSVPGPVLIEAIPSFFKILFNWNCPERPNGVITQYVVEYMQTDLSQNATTVDMGLVTDFTVSGLELETEVRFSVRAYTRVGAGVWSSVIVSTLRRPRK